MPGCPSRVSAPFLTKVLGQVGYAGIEVRATSVSTEIRIRVAKHDNLVEEGARRISNLVNKGKIFKLIYLNPKLLALAKTIINSNFVLSSLNGRDVLKDHGEQKIH